MNAAACSTNTTDNTYDSDSDTNSDEIPDYYQPLSPSDGDDNAPIINGYHPTDQSLSNGHNHSPEQTSAQNGVSSLNLGDDEEERESGEDVNDDEEEMRSRVESETAINRAFQEDESRRNAPLSSENTTRVIEAMRRVSFSGFAPDWADHVPEDRWRDQLQQLRQPPRSTA